jgi:hypothetical protein
MEQNLISIKEIIVKGWKIYSKNFRLFLKPILIILAGSLVLTIFQIFFIAQGADLPSGLLIIPFILLLLIFAFIYLWIMIYVIKLADSLYKNQPIDLKQLWPQSYRKIPSFFWVEFIMGLIVGLGYILLIIPGIIFTVWYSFASYINVLEGNDNKGFDALQSSKGLVQGRWFKTMWRLILPYLAIYLPVAIIGMIIMGGIALILGSANYSEDVAMMILNPVSMLLDIIYLFLMPLFIIFPVILYNSLKATKQAPAVQSTQPNQQ